MDKIIIEIGISGCYVPVEDLCIKLQSLQSAKQRQCVHTAKRQSKFTVALLDGLNITVDYIHFIGHSDFKLITQCRPVSYTLTKSTFCIIDRNLAILQLSTKVEHMLIRMALFGAESQ